MPPTNRQIREFVRNAQYDELFNSLGWDNVPANQQYRVVVKGQTIDLRPVAHKRGFVVLLHESPSADLIPDRSTGLKIENKLTSLAAEHLIIFTDADRSKQVWQWSRRVAGSPIRIRRETFLSGTSGERLAQKLSSLFFSLDEEEELTIADVSRRAESQFRERITKRFYDKFKTEHGKFCEQVEGIPDEIERDRFTSLTLNRLMFVYFVQSKGFLNNDKEYLRTKLNETRNTVGRDMFYAFYDTFLSRFFHEGLGESDRSPELVALVGNVPYLNGGLFERHSVEVENTVAIKDEAFEKIFDFFDYYDWHLDDRPLKDDRHINPEVLGYIFEKFINQKQMGAYYTKEDITEYISKNTIIPFLFDRVKEKVKIAFDPKDGVWKLLREDPDRYIYDAVRKGVIDAEGNEIEVPADIAAGIPDVSRRTGWNRTADAEFGLPTETWREYIARRQRCLEIREKLTKGEVRDINDLITYNLDIRRFAEDVIFSAESPDLVKAFYHAIAGRIPEKSNERFEYGVSILDPTCGSGAFLFAALKILEPLLSACLDRIEDFVEDEDQLRPGSKKFAEFRRVLDEAEKHPNRKYFILKSIIVNNLFGVDIMPDAVEICKLRLFLTLVAEVDPDPRHHNLGLEPLPDIDFNIRSGNTLVGFATEKQVYEAFEGAEQGRLSFDSRADDFKWRAEQTASKYEQFRLQQVKEGGNISPEDKAVLAGELRALSDELDIYTAHEYGIKETDEKKFTQFLASHQPFHWYSEFYSIIANGGFDVIIGNPPWVEYGKISRQYTTKSYRTQTCNNLWTYTMERSEILISMAGRLGLIVPMSLVCTRRMVPIQELISRMGKTWLANVESDSNPGQLFDGVKQNVTLMFRAPSGPGCIYSSRLFRFFAEYRDFVFPSIAYKDLRLNPLGFGFPKIGSELEIGVLEKVFSHASLSIHLSETSDKRVLVHRIAHYYIKCFDFTPYFRSDRDGEKKSEDYKEYAALPPIQPIVAFVNSSTFYFYWQVFFDGFKAGKECVERFPAGRPEGSIRDVLASVASQLMEDMRANATRLRANYRTSGNVEYDQFYPRRSKSIMDRIDQALSPHYGFTDEELDFIINYDIKYRMGAHED